MEKRLYNVFVFIFVDLNARFYIKFAVFCQRLKCFFFLLFFFFFFFFFLFFCFSSSSSSFVVFYVFLGNIYEKVGFYFS